MNKSTYSPDGLLNFFTATIAALCLLARSTQWLFTHVWGALKDMVTYEYITCYVPP